MKDTLKLFTRESMFNATSALLSKLSISFDRETAQPIDVADLYEGQMPKYLTDALKLISDTYFIGIVNDKSLNGEKSGEGLDSIQRQMQRGDKYDGLFIFACDAKQGESLTRSAIAALTRAFNHVATANPVILFVRQGQMLSLATCERMDPTQKWREGEKLGKVSVLRNINCESPHRGHTDILEKLNCGDCTTFEKLYQKWMKVFSTDVLTKKFYDDLFGWYQWVLEENSTVHFPGNLWPKEDKQRHEDKDTSVIRLITRLMFVWFIKQKGLVPDSIFDKNYVASILKDFDPESTTSSVYYQAILQNLFFGTLNRPILEDGEVRTFKEKDNQRDAKNLYRYADLFKISKEEVVKIFSCVPFLNCGLFECQDKDKTLDGKVPSFFKDGFTTNSTLLPDGSYKNRAVVPNIYFFDKDKGLFSIFEKYVFTIEENTPQDEQVALDPELLGKVFENLLGAYNPETQETARNESGSFYTPREIVQYMVNESLVAHLKRTVSPDLEQQYRDLLDYTTENVELTDHQKKDIIHALFTCKILDPACGSGAFPMGMLQQMVHILRQVDPDNSQWRHVLENLAMDETRLAFGIVDEDERNQKLAEIRDTFNNGLNSPDYTRKLYIIESCIYGVDIQPIAMLITRLRFFITLICEQKDIRRDKPEDNFGIKTLPNLESKFVAANSLINADIHKYNEDWTQDECLTLLKNELIAIRRRHFYTRKRTEKMSLLREDEKKRQQIQEHINKLVGEPNEAKIADLNERIRLQEEMLPRYEGEDWAEEVVQMTLFDEPKFVRYDRNKRERDHINFVIKQCRADIEREYNKCTPQGFEAAVLQVTDWNPYDQNTPSPFLDVEWMFGLTEGFDVVMGNPPYIRRTKINEEDKIIYEKEYKSATGQYDMYLLFLERGMKLLKRGGILSYINPIRFFNSDYGVGCRKFMACLKINSILDVSQLNVFKSAQTYPCILNIENTAFEGDHTIKYLKLKDLSELEASYTLDTIDVPQSIISQDKDCRFLIGNVIDYKINTIIESSCYRINEKFDIARGLANSKVDFNTHRVAALKSTAVHKYFHDAPIKVDTSFASSFVNDMVIMPRTVKTLVATYKESNLVCLDRIYYLSSKKQVNKYFVIGVLNSKLLTYWFEFNYFTTKIRGNYFDLNGDQIGSIPIVNASPSDIESIETLVKDILEKKSSGIDDITKEEELIDNLVFKLYNIDEDNQKVVVDKIRCLYE